MKKIKYAISFFMICATIVLTTANSVKAKQGAENGINMALKIIVPSLLPMLILTGSIVKSKCSYIADMLFGGITTKILGLPKQATSAILFGLIGGYPTGALLTDELLSSGLIDNITAKRLLRFNFGGGIAFIITAVGTVKLGNTKAGIILFLCNSLSSLIICEADRLIYKDKYYYEQKDKMCLTDSILSSVEQSTESVLIMTGYIVFFSAICNIIELPDRITPLIEITNGIFGSTTESGFSEIAFYLGFGGICVHFQIIKQINNAGMKYIDFLLHRVAGGILSYIISYVYTHFFPEEKSVFSNFSVQGANTFQCNAILSIILLAGCIVLVCDIKSRKIKLA